MAPTNPLDALRRRIGHGTTPVAFAALAEEHRRSGRLDEAVTVCREGLARYPTYASARVTLGRALLDLGDVRGACAELEEAIAQAPDNLAAVRALDIARLRMDEASEPAGPPDALDAAAAPDEQSDDEVAAYSVPSDALAWLGPVADQAADDPADDAGGASFASEWPAADDEPPAAVAPPWDAIVAMQAEAETLFSWGATTSSDPPSHSAFASWNASVEEAVADVFAEAAGEASATRAAEATVPVDTPIDATIDAPADDPLDSLQTLLATIRARRALLSEPQSGVD